MTRLLAIGLVGITWLASLAIVASGAGVEAERIGAAEAGATEMGIDPETTGNTASTLGALESCVRVDVPSPSFDDVSDYNIDVYIKGDVQAPIAYDVSLNYDQGIVHIAAPGTNDLIKLPGAVSFSDTLPDSDGRFIAGAGYVTGGPGAAGDGALVRLGLDIGGSGVVTFTLNPPPASAYASGAGSHNLTLVSAQLAINQDCSTVPPSPSPTPAPSTPTPGTPTPGTPMPTPPPGTVMLVSGWNNSCYIGPEQPIEDALADVADHVLGVYRMRADQGFDRWFPNRPEASNITTVSPYQSLFILMGQYAFWPHEPSGTPPTSVPLVRAWNSVCYAGQTKSPGDAAAGLAGGFVIMYRLGSDQGWRRYAPARPELTNIVQLNQYDTVLVLVNHEGGTSWTFDP
jgi:hypothetical protein